MNPLLKAKKEVKDEVLTNDSNIDNACWNRLSG